MTFEAYRHASRGFRLAHGLNLLVLTPLLAWAVSPSFAVSFLCGGAVGAIFLDLLLRSSFALFGSANGVSGPSPTAAKAIILLKPILMFALAWFCLRSLGLSPVGWMLGFLILLPSMGWTGWLEVRRAS